MRAGSWKLAHRRNRLDEAALCPHQPYLAVRVLLNCFNGKACVVSYEVHANSVNLAWRVEVYGYRKTHPSRRARPQYSGLDCSSFLHKKRQDIAESFAVYLIRSGGPATKCNRVLCAASDVSSEEEINAPPLWVYRPRLTRARPPNWKRESLFKGQKHEVSRPGECVWRS